MFVWNYVGPFSNGPYNPHRSANYACVHTCLSPYTHFLKNFELVKNSKPADRLFSSGNHLLVIIRIRFLQ